MDKQYFNTVKARRVDKKGEMKEKVYTWHLIPRSIRNRTNIESIVAEGLK